MSICQNMISDFLYGTGRRDDEGYELYDASDLETGLQYAEDLIGDGYIKEPFHGYNLKEFVKWCRRVLARNTKKI